MQALDGLDLVVPRGAIFGLLGPNGAGKTTTVRALLGLVRPDAGALRVLGLDPGAEPGAVRAATGALLESDGLYDRLSGWDNLDYHARLRHVPSAARGARIEELLRLLALWDRRRDPVVLWSRGMRQKLAVARALLHRPALLLLDEPFTGLDPAAAVELRDRIAALAREQGVTVLLTTHDLAHVEKACTAVAVVLDGRVIACGAPGDLASGGGQDVEVRGEGLDDAVLAGLERDALIAAGWRRDGVRARVRSPAAARPRLGTELVRRGVRLEELRSAGPSLEDAFLRLVAQAKAEP